MSGGAHDVPREVREVTLAWMLARKDDRQDLADWRRSMPYGMRVALDRLLEAMTRERAVSGPNAAPSQGESGFKPSPLCRTLPYQL